MSPDDIKAGIERWSPWYHSIDLGGIVTPGWNKIEPIWNSIRGVRSDMTYRGKRVLDLGCRDGMWAFEAERREAAVVVATDIAGGDRLYFAKQALNSKVIPYFNVPAEDAYNRLDCFWRGNPGRFDIVQHLGLLYHLQDPICSLVQARKCLADDGLLLLETAALVDNSVPMARFNSDSGIYVDSETYWAFNQPALFAALRITGFEPVTESVSTVEQDNGINRICLIAKAVMSK